LAETSLDANPDADAAARDFPFYVGRPTRISGWGWLTVFSFSAAGFITLGVAQALWFAPLGRAAGIVAFLAAPLLGLHLVAGRGWRALFNRPTARDIRIGFIFAPVTLVAAALAAAVTSLVAPTTANPATDLVQGMSAPSSRSSSQRPRRSCSPRR
jgi:hypothetical protein